MQRVAILQPYVPNYREPLFRALARSAIERDIVVDVYYGEPTGTFKLRSDNSRPGYGTEVRTLTFSWGGRAVRFKNVFPFLRNQYDLIIVEQALGNLEIYPLLLNRNRTPVALWGHGKTYGSIPGPFREAAKWSITSRAHWFFAYTPEGAAAVAAHRFPTDRITVLNNSVDTEVLASDIDEVSPHELTDFCQRRSLTTRTALFIGALEPYKRLDFLIRAASRAHLADPSFRLVVAGAGSLASQITDLARSRQWLVPIGPVTGHQKALALRAAQVIALPGAIGLIAVDSLAAGRPIVTTEGTLHGPEFDYLEEGTTTEVAPNEPDAYAGALINLLRSESRLAAMQNSCRSERKKYSIEAMSENFLEGILHALARH